MVVANYIYMELVPIVQTLGIQLLTTQKDRRIRM
jgi:Na+-transporting methylmalonyl-CoA/oxaloacetate decarboxylase, beta subunit